jgi:hypothetical protein
MARNGAGTYNLPIGNPVTTGTTISSTWANNTLTDIATALTGSISSDGQTVVSANLPMGGYAHTGVASATVRTMYASAGQVQDNTAAYLTSVSGTNAITAVAAFGMSAYATGQRFSFVAAGANTGATTININSIGAKAVTKNGTTALVAGDIPSGAVVDVVYDGTQFQLLNVAAEGVATISFGTTGLTPSTATDGAVTVAGTLNVANGGTGLTTLTANNVLLGNGTSSVQAVAPGTSGNVLTSNGTTWASSAPAPAIGVGQSWQSPSRSMGTTYTNSTGKPIEVFIVIEHRSNSTSTITVNGVSFAGSGSSASGYVWGTNSFIVPDGYTYSISAGGTYVLNSWAELR